MNIKKFIFLAILVAGLMLLCSNQAMSQRGNQMLNRPKGQGINRVIPDLTEAQQKKIDEIRLVHQKNMLGFRNELSEKDAHLQTLRTADKADMTAINQTVDEIGAIRTQMMKERENHFQQVRAQLTDEQRLRFDMTRGNFERRLNNNPGMKMRMHGMRGPGNPPANN